MGRNEMKIEGDRVTLCQMTEKDLDFASELECYTNLSLQHSFSRV